MTNAKLRQCVVALYKHAGWIFVGAAFASIPAASPRLAAWACLALIGWGVTCFLPGLADPVRRWAKGTRSARKGLFAKVRKARPLAFLALSPIDQAAAARTDPAIQRAFWWDASAVMWMLAFPGREHEWRGMMSAPGWFDDALAWRDEIMAKLEEAADEGWICPSARMAWLLEKPELADSSQELGQALAAYAMLGDPWPSKVRYCETLASMGHKLYDLGFAEALAWRSHGALERLRMISDMREEGETEPPSAGVLRL